MTSRNIYNDSAFNAREIQGIQVSSIAPSNNQTLIYLSSSNDYIPTSISSSILPNNVVYTTATQTLTNKTLITPIITSISNSGTITIPTENHTLSTLDGTETLTNKTLTSPTINSAQLNEGFLFNVNASPSTQWCQMGATGDAVPRFNSYYDGTMIWSAGSSQDTKLKRSSANTLQIDNNSGGSATLLVDNITSLQTNGNLNLTANGSGNISLTSPIQSAQSSSTTNFLTSLVSGDSTNRLAISANGDHSWSSGSGSSDLRITRSSANNLSIDNGVSGGIAFLQIHQILGNSNDLVLSGFSSSDHVNISQNCAGLTLGNTTSGYTAAALNYYEQGSVAGTISGPFSSVSYTYYLYRIGKIVIAYFPGYHANGNNSSQPISFSNGIPTRFLANDPDSVSFTNTLYSYSGGTGQLGFFSLGSGGSISVYTATSSTPPGAGNFSSSATTTGFDSFSCSWTVS
jgi:hypothetical protein